MSEPSMVERVARGICQQQGFDPDTLVGLPHPSGRGIRRVPCWHQGIPVASTAIEAMRDDLSKSMVETAVAVIYGDGPYPDGDWPWRVPEALQAALDAALKEEGSDV